MNHYKDLASLGSSRDPVGHHVFESANVVFDETETVNFG